MRSFISILLVSSFLFLYVRVSATHNRAGEITYEQIDELTIRASITTWTKTSSVDVDRDSLPLSWGDGITEFVSRSNGNGTPLDNDIKMNIYTAEHTYPGRGSYILSMNDPNRIGGILNVNFPNSVNVRFFIQTTLTLVNSAFQGFNSTPKLLQPPIDFGCVNSIFIHNPNAFDPDGDSLSYELITPLQDSALTVPFYQLPDRIDPGPENNLTLDPITGTLMWDSPKRAGEYNVAIAINEWREGLLINTTIRDMQILVQGCEDNPPDVSAPEEICVVAGQLIEFTVTANDRDEGQLVALSSLGGPYILNSNPASFSVSESFESPPVQGIFSWQTSCDHISDQFYTVIFKATDNQFESTGLATLKIFRIKVVGPSPENVVTDRQGQSIQVQWDSPYSCDASVAENFMGFTIYRRINSSQIEIDTCSPGLENSGYVAIDFNVKNQQAGRYFFVDAEVDKGLTYCYRIVAEFGSTSSTGLPFNLVEGLPSDESCQMLSQDLPLIVNVDVAETSSDNGQIFIKWLKPNLEDLDTTLYPGPYQFRLFRGDGISGQNFQEVEDARIVFDRFSDKVDSSYLDHGLATANQAYSYRVDFFVGNSESVFSVSPAASSVFASTKGIDRIIELSWESSTPWDNPFYTIFRSLDGGPFDSLTQVKTSFFKDRNLTNDLTYCYIIKAFGSYGLENIQEPLINRSQITCAVPNDTIPPCALTIEVSNICESNPIDINTDEFINTIRWNNPNIACSETNDAIGYRVYFGSEEGQALQLIEEITNINTLSTTHQSNIGVAGCYSVTSFDAVGNEGPFGTIVCVDNCPDLVLPNTFTPNGDGANDVFGPVVSQFIAELDVKIYDRWGILVFESNDPQFAWDGTNTKNKALAEGTYYYSCKIFEQRVIGIVAIDEEISGFIHLLR